jgi:magnesium transporter
MIDTQLRFGHSLKGYFISRSFSNRAICYHVIGHSSTSELRHHRQISPAQVSSACLSLQGKFCLQLRWRPNAAMRSNLHVPAPSSTLLRFLKSQSDGLCFFSANPRGFIFDHAAPRVSPLSPKPNSLHIASLQRCVSTTTSKPATLEAGFLNLDSLWPRAGTLATQGRPGHRARRGSRRTDSTYTSQRYASNDRKGWHGSGEGRGWHASNNDRGWLRHLWGRKQKMPRPLKSDDLPLGSFLEQGGEAPMFNLGRNMSPKSANEAKLRCTEFDENGNVVLVNGEFKKSELIAKVW